MSFTHFPASQRCTSRHCVSWSPAPHPRFNRGVARTEPVGALYEGMKLPPQDLPTIAWPLRDFATAACEPLRPHPRDSRPAPIDPPTAADVGSP
jgi:hypothetical protein